MKHYIAFNTTNANWWDGKTFHAENPPLLITAPQLAVLRATYDNVVGTEVVTVPTVTEEEEKMEPTRFMPWIAKSKARQNY